MFCNLKKYGSSEVDVLLRAGRGAGTNAYYKSIEQKLKRCLYRRYDYSYQKVAEAILFYNLDDLKCIKGIGKESLHHIERVRKYLAEKVIYKWILSKKPETSVTVSDVYDSLDSIEKNVVCALVGQAIVDYSDSECPNDLNKLKFIGDKYISEFVKEKTK